MRTNKTYKYEMTWEQKNQILMMSCFFKNVKGKGGKTPILDSLIKMMIED